MVFSSPIFLFYFLPVVLLAYYLLRKHIVLQNLILFVSSLLFYFWGEKGYSILVLISILINYNVGLLLSKQGTQTAQKITLASGIILNISILLYFKYYNFFINDFLTYFNLATPLEESDKIHLPIHWQ
jgi:alginate O-acetyltransferase complex protein AlgI